MRALLRENIGEALVGFVVVVIAVWFFIFAWQRTGGGNSANALHVTALFPNATGVGVGTDVRIAGLKVGTVSASALDPTTWQAKVTLALDPETKVPADSSAAITSEGLLGGSYIALIPGGDTTPLKDGDEILDTQGAVDLMGMVGSFINRSGSEAASPAPGAGADGAATIP